MINDVNRQILSDRRDRRIRAFLVMAITAQIMALVIGVLL